MAQTLRTIAAPKETTTTSAQDSYFGAIKQRQRRTTKANVAETEFEAGRQTFSQFSDVLGRIGGKAVGPSEQAGLSSQRSAGQITEYNNQDSSKSAAYARGDISYDEYSSFLNSTLNRYVPGSSQFLQRTADIRTEQINKAYSDINDITARFNRNEITLDEAESSIYGFASQFAIGTDERDAIDNSVRAVRNTYATNEVTRLNDQFTNGEISAADYQQGLQNLAGTVTGGAGEDQEFTDQFTDIGNVLIDGISLADRISGVISTQRDNDFTRLQNGFNAGTTTFNEYATFLNQELQGLNAEANTSKEFTDAWKGAYSIALDRYDAQILAEFGQTSPEYKDFLNWKGDRLAEGNKLVLDLPGFKATPTTAPAPVVSANPPSATQPAKAKKTFPNVKVPPAIAKKKIPVLKKQKKNLISQIAKARKNNKPNKVAKLKKKRNQVSKALLKKRKKK